MDSEPDISKLYNDLIELAPEWDAIAFNLGLMRDIRSIDKDARDVESKLRKMLMKWEEKRPKPYTWRTIIDILREPSLEQNQLADTIAGRLV